MTLPDRLIDHDSQPRQYDAAGLNAPQIVAAVLAALGHDAVTPAQAVAGPYELIARVADDSGRPRRRGLLRDIRSSCCLPALALTAAAVVYAAGHFAMTADTAELISTQHEWRQRELAYERRSRRCRGSRSW